MRKDALPEFFVYRDTGCQVQPSCLTCPLERCIFDDPRGHYRAEVNRRAREMSQLRRRGIPIAVIARSYRLSRRTVFRYLAHIRPLTAAS